MFRVLVSRWELPHSGALLMRLTEELILLMLGEQSGYLEMVPG